MRAEFVKVRSMPTPWWCLAVAVLCFVLGLIATVIWGIGEDAAAPDLAIGFPTAIASIVFGVWIVGVEYGQNTLRRTLSADPRRIRLIIAKLLVASICVVAVTALLYSIAYPLFNLAGVVKDSTVSAEILFRFCLASMVSNIVYMLIGAAFALITASMAGGMTLALVFIFVLDTIFPAIPKYGDLAFGLALSDVTDAVRGFDDETLGEPGSTHATGVAALLVAAWTLLLLAIGSFRFSRSDVK